MGQDRGIKMVLDWIGLERIEWDRSMGEEHGIELQDRDGGQKLNRDWELGIALRAIGNMMDDG